MLSCEATLRAGLIGVHPACAASYRTMQEQKPATTHQVTLRLYWGKVVSALYLRRALRRQVDVSVSWMTPNEDHSVDLVIDVSGALDILGWLRGLAGVSGIFRVPDRSQENAATYCVFLDEEQIAALQAQAGFQPDD